MARIEGDTRNLGVRRQLTCKGSVRGFWQSVFLRSLNHIIDVG